MFDQEQAPKKKKQEDLAYDVRAASYPSDRRGAAVLFEYRWWRSPRCTVAARGFWERCEMAFFDISRVFNPYAKMHLNRSLNAAFTSNEREKKRQYNRRCIQLEDASFTPLIFSVYSRCSRETCHFLNTLSERLAEKKSILPAVAMNWLSTEICCAQVRALILCVRGSRNPWHQHSFNSTDIALSNFNAKI